MPSSSSDCGVIFSDCTVHNVTLNIAPSKPKKKLSLKLKKKVKLSSADKEGCNSVDKKGCNIASSSPKRSIY